MVKDHESATDIEVARITSRQAITVAIITAASSILITSLTWFLGGQDFRTNSVPVQQKKEAFLIIHSVQEPLLAYKKYRLFFKVNNGRYSFPTRGLWARTHTEQKTTDGIPYSVNFNEFGQQFPSTIPIPASDSSIYSIYVTIGGVTLTGDEVEPGIMRQGGDTVNVKGQSSELRKWVGNGVTVNFEIVEKELKQSAAP